MGRKSNWHKENKPIAYKLTGGKCSKCEHIGKFVIHHKTYKQIEGESIYSYSFEELHLMKLVEVLCYNCHTREHYGDNLEHCYYCGIVTEKTRSRSLKIDVILCRKCFRTRGGVDGDFTIENNQLKLF